MAKRAEPPTAARIEPATPAGPGLRALVAGVGNVLRADDGFGPRVIERLQQQGLPDDVEALEFGIGGLHLVQELMGGAYNALVIVDAVDRDKPAGTVFELEAEVPKPDTLVDGDARLHEVDLHQTDPSRILIMAAAIGALPERVRIVGCQPATTELSESLSPPVDGAVGPAVALLLRLLDDWRRDYS